MKLFACVFPLAKFGVFVRPSYAEVKVLRRRLMAMSSAAVVVPDAAVFSIDLFYLCLDILSSAVKPFIVLILLVMVFLPTDLLYLSYLIPTDPKAVYVFLSSEAVMVENTPFLLLKPTPEGL